MSSSGAAAAERARGVAGSGAQHSITHAAEEEEKKKMTEDGDFFLYLQSPSEPTYSH
jgi:hypothetical protein